MQFRPIRTVDAPHIMSGRERIGAEFLRDVQQIGELHALVAAHAGDRRFAARVGGGEILHHRPAEALFVIQHVMRNAKPFRDAARIMNVLPGATRALFLRGRARDRKAASVTPMTS